ncbi:MAG: hypothetical protein ABSH20_30565 [Tepidisphaeraceae bacterium]|jgi:hypothetical protein
MNWTLGAGGGGAIDLVIQLLHLDFKAAVDWLASPISAVLPPETATPCLPAGRPSPASELRLPPPVPGQLARIRDYLVAQRPRPSALLAPLIDSRTLYADARANAVFQLMCGYVEQFIAFASVDVNRNDSGTSGRQREQVSEDFSACEFNGAHPTGPKSRGDREQSCWFCSRRVLVRPSCVSGEMKMH